jgi:uracil-DNA glycosylase
MSLDVNLHESWKIKLQEEFDKPYFATLVQFLKNEKKIGKTIYPPGRLLFNAFDQCPFDRVKVVILGQDPYHGPGQAMGLSFSVPQGIQQPASLKNIFKELATDIGCPVPNHGDLSSWAHQGVFLLNAILSVEQSKPGSHQQSGWQLFTDRVIQVLSAHRSNLVFLLWGNFAKAKKTLIDRDKHLILEAAHPSPLAGGQFFGCRHFSKSNAYLIQHQMTPIQWQIENN